MPAPSLHTERLHLRGHVSSDLEALCDLFETERSVYMGGPIPRKYAWRWIASEVAMWDLMGHGAWGIEDKHGTFLGQIGILRPPHFPEAEIGWTLLAGAEGKGYAFEAAQVVLSWAWDQGFETMVSYIDIRNARSIALAERLGAQRDPEAPMAEGDTPDDTYVYRHRPPHSPPQQTTSRAIGGASGMSQSPPSMPLSPVTIATPGASFGASARAALPMLRTARLVLRAPDLGDFDLFLRLFSLPSAKFMDTEPDPEAIWATFTNYTAGWLLRGDGMFSVTLGEHLIGFVFAGVEPGDQAIELGFFIDPEHHRKGYAFEAAQAALLHLQALGTHPIVSYVAPGNMASQALVQKLGGVKTGALDGALVFTYPSDADGSPEAYA